MRELDLEVAGEFILMAATLIQIKVRMLLPVHEEEEEVEGDPRADLVRRLLEYKRFKEVAENLIDIEERQRRLFPRNNFNWEKTHIKGDDQEEDVLPEVTLFDLLTAFKTVLDNIPKVTPHQVDMPNITIDDQIEFLLHTIQEKKRIAFSALFKDLKDRIVIIVTFMAILELIRTHQIRVQQAVLFGEIWISDWLS
jgi:segregation and condensation protein A